MTFIKITTTDDTDTWVNIDHIVNFEMVNGITEIQLDTENVIGIKQSPHDLLLKIDQVQRS